MTFKTWLGDYGVAPEFEKLNEYELIHLLANKLGKYEDKEEQGEIEAEIADRECDRRRNEE